MSRTGLMPRLCARIDGAIRHLGRFHRNRTPPYPRRDLGLGERELPYGQFLGLRVAKPRVRLPHNASIAASRGYSGFVEPLEEGDCLTSRHAEQIAELGDRELSR